MHIQGRTEVGGIAGQSNGVSIISNTAVSGTIAAITDEVGGFVGDNDTTLKLLNVNNQGPVSGYSEVGGLIGDSIIASITGSANTATISEMGNEPGLIAGLVGDGGDGSSSRLTIHDSFNSGQINAPNSFWVGGLVGQLEGDGRITHSSQSGVITGDNVVGGVVGYTRNTLQITSVSVFGTISGNSDNIGGFIGRSNGTTRIDHATNSATVTGAEEVAGIVGDNDDVLYLNHVVNNGTVSGISEVGGLIGESEITSITRGANYALITSTSINGEQIGGLVGDAGDLSSASLSIYQSYNQGQVYGNGSMGIGGLVGELNVGTLTINESFNTGAVSGEGSISDVFVGGIIGYISDVTGNNFVEINNVYNSATVSGISTYDDVRAGGLIGGMFGNDVGALTIRDSYNSGLITGSAVDDLELGGIAGQVPPSELTLDGNDSYYLEGTAEKLYGQGSTISMDNAQRVSLFELRNISTFTSWSIGDAESTWQIYTSINHGFPYLTFAEDIQFDITFVSSKADFLAINDDLDGTYILQSDIDLSGVTYTQSAINGIFTGIFNGNGHSLTGLAIDASSDTSNDNLGLFSQLGTGSSISNVTLSAFNVTGNDQTGLLVGKIDGATDVEIRNINTINSSLSGNKFSGGLIGSIENGASVIVASILQNAEIYGNDYVVGGVIGQVIENAQLQMTDILQTGNMSSSVSGNHVGGIIGIVYQNSAHATLSGIAQHGNVTGAGTDTGGIIGQVRDRGSVYIENAYNQGTINNTSSNADSGTGGLIGRIGWLTATENRGSVTIVNAYSRGTVLADNNLGTVVGSIQITESGLTLSEVYSLTQGSIATIGNVDTGVTVTGAASVKTSTQLQNINTYNTWSIGEADSIWQINTNLNDGYPYLNFEDAALYNLTIVSSTEGMLAINNNLDGNYILQSDIDLSDFTQTNSLINGTFTGTFDGNGHTLENLSINASGVNDIGLFSQLGTGARISNVTLSAFNVTGNNQTGLLAGNIDGATDVEIRNINTTNSSLSGNTDAGALIGSIENGSSVIIESIHQTADVNAVAYHAGGVIGLIYQGSQAIINDVLQTGTISADRGEVGGVIGIVANNSQVTLSGIAQNGNLKNTNAGTSGGRLGGLIGEFRTESDGIIINSYNSGNMSNINTDSASAAGGLVGEIESTTPSSLEIINSYNVGNISATSQTAQGSVLGNSNGGAHIVTFTSVYYLENTAVNNMSIGSIGNAILNGSATSKTSSELQDSNTFTNYDFVNVWIMDANRNSGYPTLRFEYDLDLNFNPVVAANAVVSFDPRTVDLDAENITNNGVTILDGTFVFNGSSYIDLGQVLEPNSSYTKEAWVYLTNSALTSNVISSRNSVFYFSGGNDLIGQVNWSTGESVEITGLGNDILNIWTHLVLTFDDPNDTLVLYVNGQERVRNENVTDSVIAQNAFLGAHPQDTSSITGSSGWNGNMGEIRIYSQALNAEEILSNYLATKDNYSD